MNTHQTDIATIFSTVAELVAELVAFGDTEYGSSEFTGMMSLAFELARRIDPKVKVGAFEVEAIVSNHIVEILLDRIATLQGELVKSEETNKSLFAELNAIHAAERECENEEFVDMLRGELDSDLA